jgi:hypothetical protein
MNTAVRMLDRSPVGMGDRRGFRNWIIADLKVFLAGVSQVIAGDN